MYLIKVRHSFDSAHFLSGYHGKCANIHGHRWEVEVEVSSKDLIISGEQRGMVTDFSALKKDVRDIINAFDHALIVENGSLRQETERCLIEDGFAIISVPFRPTAENLAAYFFDCIKKRNYLVRRVTVYETPTNIAIYEKDED